MRYSFYVRARRLLWMATVLSLAALGAFELLRGPQNPFMDLSFKFADHFSHMNAGRLFLHFGTQVWRRPLDHLLPPPTPEEVRALPDDVKHCRDGVFVVPGWTKPVEQSWPTVVRFYPPGDMVLTAPIALLYHFTDLSFTNANRLLLLLLLAIAHAALFLLLDGLRAQRFAIAIVPALLCVNVVLHWTLEGIYDAAMIIPLLLCIRFLQERRGLAAAVAFCAALFLHFRAVYYLPWGVASVALLCQEWHRLTKPQLWVAAAGVVLALSSLGAFLLTVPGLMAFRDSTSVLLIASHHVDGGALLAFAVVLAVALLLLARAPLDAAVLCWMALLLTVVRQSYPWYSIALVPWLGAPVDRQSGGRVVAARVLVFLFLAVYVHRDGPGGAYSLEGATPLWIPRLLH